MKRRLALALAPCIALGIVVARNTSVAALQRWWESLVEPAKLVTLLLGLCGFLLLLLVPIWVALWIPESDLRWKKALIAHLKLAPRTATQLSLCIYCRGPLRARDLRNNIEMGLLAWGPDGLALFGADGRRVLLRSTELVQVEKKHMLLLFPPREALCLITRWGIEHSFAPVERATRAANRTLIHEMAAALGHSSI